MAELVAEIGSVRRVSAADWVEVEGPRARVFLEGLAVGRGALTVDGVRHTGPVGWFPADRLVFPHLSVRENLGYAAGSRAEVNRMAEALGLSEWLERRPRALTPALRAATALGRAMLAGALWVLEGPFEDPAWVAVVRAEQAARGAIVLGAGLPEPRDRWSV